MKVKFLKDHPSGLVKGEVKDLRPATALKLIEKELAEEVKRGRKKKEEVKEEE